MKTYNKKTDITSRKGINLDNEISELRNVFSSVKDKRALNSRHKLSDILMSCFAMFSLKHASLHDFSQRNRLEESNLQAVYGINSICSDSQLRDTLDDVNPSFLRDLFPKKFETLHNTGILDEFSYPIGGTAYHLISCDGVQHFSSKAIGCDCCLTKSHKDGTTTCHHNMLCAALVHPDKRETFFLDVEPIKRQDGNKKNDCEINAAKRLQENIHKNYEKYQKKYNFLFIEDALYANAPHIKILEDKQFSYILNVKPDSHKTLFAVIKGKKERKEIKTYNTTINDIKHEFEYINNVILCNADPEIRVNFIQYTQTDKKGIKTTFTWVTNIPLKENKLMSIMKAGRARWKIENETFNTLKNLGYNFEHNYGHGKQHLSTVFAFMMLLAFYIDQLIQYCCHKFKKLEEKIATKIKLWTTIMAIFQTMNVKSINQIYQIAARLFNIKLE
jgi:hypothetical protein